MKKTFLFIVSLLLMASGSYAEKSSFVYDDHGRRDPFWQLVGPSGSIINYGDDIDASDMALEGIMADEEGKDAAIINGTIVKIDETIGPFILKEIGEDFVILQKGQEKVTLRLKKGEVR